MGIRQRQPRHVPEVVVGALLAIRGGDIDELDIAAKLLAAKLCVHVPHRVDEVVVGVAIAVEVEPHHLALELSLAHLTLGHRQKSLAQQLEREALRRLRPHLEALVLGKEQVPRILPPDVCQVLPAQLVELHALGTHGVDHQPRHHIGEELRLRPAATAAAPGGCRRLPQPHDSGARKRAPAAAHGSLRRAIDRPRASGPADQAAARRRAADAQPADALDGLRLPKLARHELPDLGDHKDAHGLADADAAHAEGALCQVAEHHVLAEGQCGARVERMLDCGGGCHSGNVWVSSGSEKAREQGEGTRRDDKPAAARSRPADALSIPVVWI